LQPRSWSSDEQLPCPRWDVRRQQQHAGIPALPPRRRRPGLHRHGRQGQGGRQAARRVGAPAEREGAPAVPPAHADPVGGQGAHPRAGPGDVVRRQAATTPTVATAGVSRRARQATLRR
jgi:hypothetical protein